MGVQSITLATFKNPAGGGGFDTDAQAFFTATGISDGTIQAAVDALVISLKADGIWAKCIAIYPFVGGSSSTHAVNLKNPGTHDITWNGTVTHDSDGITGNGSTGHGDLNLTPSTHLSLNDNHMSIYCRTAGGFENVRDLGSNTSDFFALFIRRNDAFEGNMYTAATTSVGNSNAQGFYLVSRRGATDFEAYKNGSSVATNTGSTGGSLPSQSLYICARNSSGTASSFTARNYAFASVGSSLTDTEAANFTTRVETFQDALSRGVV